MLVTEPPVRVYALLVRVGVVAVDQRERLEHVRDRLDAGVRPALPLVLAPVVVDVAEPALLLGAEVLAEAQHREVDQVAPLDRRGGLHHGLAVRERVAVVLGHRRQPDVGDRATVEGQAERAVLAAGDAVRASRVHAHRDDRAPELVRPSGQRDLLRRPAPRRLAELGERSLVEREDEVRLGLHLAVEVVAQRRRVERDPGAEQVLLEHRLARHVRVALHQRLEERSAGSSHVAHECKVSADEGRGAPLGVGEP